MVKSEPFEKYSSLLNYVANAKGKSFDGGPNYVMDGDFILCKITYQGKTRQISKSSPLSLDSPLLYSLFNETLQIGAETEVNPL
ncbi:hypothetical protein [Mucilaginibacter antarcticus]|uniref:hypothetical protein n=1 Tax=Mucilaginibacter antarcticus TaxID=1855725 RepID=UPI003645E124